MDLGRYELEKGIYCAASSAQLVKKDEFFFEANRKYADLHYALDGTQRM